jgi:secreted trypsin-like serine protease
MGYQWGGPKLACLLEEGSMAVLSTDEANARLEQIATLSDRQLAVYDPNNNVTPCRGDDGSGLYCQSGGNLVLCGINSFGVRTNDVCLATYPFVTTRVSSYLGWIKNHTPRRP